MKYVVINCIERKICKVGEANTPSEATEIMRIDFMKEFKNDNRTEDDFKNGIDEDDEWNLYETEAWLNGRYGNNYDWKIIEVGNE